MSIHIFAPSYDHYIIEYDGIQLHMNRRETEDLFVVLGHTLQDQDVIKYDETGDDTPQPEGEINDDNNADRVASTS